MAHCASSLLTIRSSPTPEVGYISALTSGPCPSSTYELRAQRGQRWNISLFDFASVRTLTSAGTKGEGGATAWKPTGSLCRRYGVIREYLDAREAASANSGYSDEMIVCGGTSDRQRTVFLSQTQVIRLEVRAHDAADVDDQTELFLLQFAGKLLLVLRQLQCASVTMSRCTR